MLSYKDFKEKFLIRANLYIPHKYIIRIKNTGDSDVPYDILYMTEQAQQLPFLPFMQVKDLYDEYLKSDDDITKIISDAVKILFDAVKNFKCMNPHDITEYIVLSLINYENNKELLRNVPHKRFLDLAVVFKWIFLSNESEILSAFLINETLDILGYDFDTLYEKAKDNTFDLIPYKTEKLIDYFNYNPLTKGKYMENIIVVTSDKGHDGAVYMLYPKVLQGIKEKN
ncbi:MAG: hypothetical protein IJ583_15940 [Firmicutes bacterium]|nr:hypothetical protein [Bacillota bacterium]